MYNRTLAFILMFLCAQSSVFAKGLAMGGSDTGGGSGVIVNQKLLLQDFESCSVIANTSFKFQLKTEDISPSIQKFDSLQIAAFIEERPKFSNEIFKKLMAIAAARANWYLVDADLSLKDQTSQKIAIFKRPLGILINKNLFNQLSEIGQQGLIFHEALRMLSLGLGFNIDLKTIEVLTCQAFSKEADLTLYSSLNEYVTNWIKLYTTSGHTLTEATNTILIDLENYRQLDDINFPLWVQSSENMIYQGNISKFEKLRSMFPLSASEFLEESFFSWAAVEAPVNCTTLKDCHYFEEWPKNETRLFPTIERWDLFQNTDTVQGWITEDRSLSIIISKQEFTRSFCKKISLLTGDDYKLLEPIRNRFQISDHNLGFIIGRKNLDYFNVVEIKNFNRPICIKAN